MNEGILTNHEKKSSSKLGNVFTWVLIILLIIIAIFLMYVFVTAAIAKKNDENPPVSLYTIVSPSMEPKIKVYDVVINMRPKSVDDIKVGDVITFHSTSTMYSARLITHRVIDIRELEDGSIEYQTQGDNNLSPDDTTVPYDNIVGEVVFTIPQLGRLKFLLSSVGGWIALILVPALIIIIYDLVKLNKLVTAKNKVDKMNQSTENQAKLEKEQKQSIKDKLLNKYKNKKLPQQEITTPEVKPIEEPTYNQTPISETQPVQDYNQIPVSETKPVEVNYNTYQEQPSIEEHNIPVPPSFDEFKPPAQNQENKPLEENKPKIDINLIMSRINDSENNDKK